MKKELNEKKGEIIKTIKIIQSEGEFKKFIEQKKQEGYTYIFEIQEGHYRSIHLLSKKKMDEFNSFDLSTLSELGFGEVISREYAEKIKSASIYGNVKIVAYYPELELEFYVIEEEQKTKR